MRTSPTGRSSTSGVSPIRSSSDVATTLGIAAPDVDRRTELAEQLVHAPGSRPRVRADAGRAVALDQVRRPSVESRQAEQVAARIPRTVFDHALAPFASERRARDARQARSRGVTFDRVGVRTLRDDRDGVEERRRLAGLERVGCARYVGEPLTPGAEGARGFGEDLREVDV